MWSQRTFGVSQGWIDRGARPPDRISVQFAYLDRRLGNWIQRERTGRVRKDSINFLFHIMWAKTRSEETSSISVSEGSLCIAKES